MFFSFLACRISTSTDSGPLDYALSCYEGPGLGKLLFIQIHFGVLCRISTSSDSGPLDYALSCYGSPGPCKLLFI